MNEFIYTTWTQHQNEWVKKMLNGWEIKKKPFLCFPWIKFGVHTLTNESFWMYFYYSPRETDIDRLKGKIEYRVLVSDWSESIFFGDDIHSVRDDEDGTAWFKCSLFQQVRKADSMLLSLSDFNHRDGKRLGSTMRNSIPPVICDKTIAVVRQYPDKDLYR